MYAYMYLCFIYIYIYIYIYNSWAKVLEWSLKYMCSNSSHVFMFAF